MNTNIKPDETAPLPSNLPWSWQFEPINQRNKIIMRNKNGDKVAEFYSPHEARLVFDAVNTHAALIEALESLVSFSFDQARKTTGYDAAVDELIKIKRKARVALAAAKEGAK